MYILPENRIPAAIQQCTGWGLWCILIHECDEWLGPLPCCDSLHIQGCCWYLNCSSGWMCSEWMKCKYGCWFRCYKELGLCTAVDRKPESCNSRAQLADGQLFLTNGCCSSAETNFVLGFNSLFLSQMSLLCVLKQDPSSRKLIYMVFIWRRHLSLSFVSLCSGFDLVYQVPLVPRKHSASLWLINSDDCSRSVFLCEETF